MARDKTIILLNRRRVERLERELQIVVNDLRRIEDETLRTMVEDSLGAATKLIRTYLGETK
jgi:hypothetical protein